MLFRTENLTKHFYGVTAVDNVDIFLEEGEIVGLIGPNGSGKTTFFNCVTGLLRPEGGRVFFEEGDITGQPSYKVSNLGISRTFQEVRIFSKLSVMDNMLVSVQDYQETNLLARIIKTSHIDSLEKTAQEKAEELLDMVSLGKFRNEDAEHLSYGQRKLLGLVTALMCDPTILLLDEPAAGVNLTTIEEIKDFIKKLNEKGLTILLVEHNMDVVMNLCDRVIVLDYGKKIAEGEPVEIQSNEQVLEAYFGK